MKRLEDVRLEQSRQMILSELKQGLGNLKMKNDNDKKRSDINYYSSDESFQRFNLKIVISGYNGS